jgi:hypothetical protein
MTPAEAADPEKRLCRLERCHLRNGLESKLKPAETPCLVRATLLSFLFNVFVLQKKVWYQRPSSLLPPCELLTFDRLHCRNVKP